MDNKESGGSGGIFGGGQHGGIGWQDLNNWGPDKAKIPPNGYQHGEMLTGVQTSTPDTITLWTPQSYSGSGEKDKQT